MTDYGRRHRLARERRQAIEESKRTGDRLRLTGYCPGCGLGAHRPDHICNAQPRRNA